MFNYFKLVINFWIHLSSIDTFKLLENTNAFVNTTLRYQPPREQLYYLYHSKKRSRRTLSYLADSGTTHGVNIAKANGALVT